MRLGRARHCADESLPAEVPEPRSAPICGSPSRDGRLPFTLFGRCYCGGGSCYARETGANGVRCRPNSEAEPIRRTVGHPLDVGPAGAAFLSVFSQSTSPLANPDSRLPASRKAIEEELLAARGSVASDQDRCLLREALMCLATYVPDETASLINAGLTERVSRLSREQTEVLEETINGIGQTQRFYLIMLGDDGKPQIDEFLDTYLTRQREGLKTHYGGMGTFAWIAACLYKVFTANALTTGLGGLAFLAVGMIAMGIISGIPFYLLHRVVVSILPKSEIAWWVRPLGIAQQLLQFGVVFLVGAFLFDWVFRR